MAIPLPNATRWLAVFNQHTVVGALIVAVLSVGVAGFGATFGWKALVLLGPTRETVALELGTHQTAVSIRGRRGTSGARRRKGKPVHVSTAIFRDAEGVVHEARGYFTEGPGGVELRSEEDWALGTALAEETGHPVTRVLKLRHSTILPEVARIEGMSMTAMGWGSLFVWALVGVGFGMMARGILRGRQGVWLARHGQIAMGSAVQVRLPGRKRRPARWVSPVEAGHALFCDGPRSATCLVEFILPGSTGAGPVRIHGTYPANVIEGAPTPILIYPAKPGIAEALVAIPTGPVFGRNGVIELTRMGDAVGAAACTAICLAITILAIALIPPPL